MCISCPSQPMGRRPTSGHFDLGIPGLPLSECLLVFWVESNLYCEISGHRRTLDKTNGYTTNSILGSVICHWRMSDVQSIMCLSLLHGLRSWLTLFGGTCSLLNHEMIILEHPSVIWRSYQHMYAWNFWDSRLLWKWIARNRSAEMIVSGVIYVSDRYFFAHDHSIYSRMNSICSRMIRDVTSER